MREVNITFNNSIIECKFFYDESDDILEIKISGICRKGSDGGWDINKVFYNSIMYFIYLQPSAIIFDLSYFKYEMSNSIYLILNFTDNIGRNEDEKRIPTAYILSKNNVKGISSFLNLSEDCLPINYFLDYKPAYDYVKELIGNV